jgi:hypothetical protein
MTWKKWALLLSSLASSHKAGAATVAGAAGAALVVSPLTEAVLSVVAGFGAAVAVHAMREPTTVMRAVGSAVVCVFLGAFGGPAASALAGHYLGMPQHWAVTVGLSFLVAATWPVTAPFVWQRLQALLVAVTPTGAAKGGDDGRA